MISLTIAPWLAIASLTVALITVICIVFFENRRPPNTNGAKYAALTRWILLLASCIILLWSVISTDTGEANNRQQEIKTAVEAKYGITLTQEQTQQLNTISETYDKDTKLPLEAKGATIIDGTKVILIQENDEIYLLQKHNNTFIEYTKH